MFTKIFIDNFLGISAPVMFDFISQSRNKDKLNSVIKIEDGIYVNKLVGIIGGNASGKTSILAAINMIGQILTSPILQFDLNDKMDSIRELLEKDNNIEDRKLLRDMIDSINSGTDIVVQNLRRKDEDTIIEVEMYITSDEEELTGYYTYKVRLNGKSKKIKNEFLGFRKKYKGKNEPIIRIEDAKEGQVYYINRFFRNITDIDKESKTELEKKYKYCKVFVEHYIKNSATLDTSEDCNYKDLKYIDWYKKAPESLRTLVRVVDPKIKDVKIDNDNKYEELVFVLKDGSNITRSMLSTGTERFLNLIRYVNEIIDKNGVLAIDEIEQNLHKDLVELIIKLFSEMTNKNAQIIFTTLSPEIFDIVDENNKKIFKQDTIFIINCDNDDVQIDKLIDLQIDGGRVNGDASVANLYKRKKISCHPDKEQIKLFLSNFKNNRIDF